MSCPALSASNLLCHCPSCCCPCSAAFHRSVTHFFYLLFSCWWKEFPGPSSTPLLTSPPTCAEPSYRPSPCLCGTLCREGPSSQRRKHAHASVADPGGWEKEGPRSALRLMGSAPRHREPLLPKEPRQLQLFLPLVSVVPDLFVTMAPCCMYVLLLPVFLSARLYRRSNDSLFPFQINKDVYDWVYNKISVPMIPMLSTANQSFWSAWDNQCDHNELIKFQQAKITDVKMRLCGLFVGKCLISFGYCDIENT